ncbi:MAG: biotin/lipoyl-containing protein, partial [Panacagrimonas sp.]
SECGFEVMLDGKTIEVRIIERTEGRGRIEVDGIAEGVDFVASGSALHLQFRGRDYRFTDRSRSATSTAAAGSDGRIRASMNGRVVAVHAKVGDRLEAGQAVFTLEAMKMEHTHTAPVAGTLKQLNAAMGDQIAAARVVAELEKETA